MKIFMAISAISEIMAVRGSPATAQRVGQFKPSEADPRVVAFDDPNVVIEPAVNQPDIPLLIFFPGTGGKPANLLALLRTAASQGYRVLGLSYDNEPAVDQVCPRDPDPACSLNFRASRLSSSTTIPVETNVADAALTRLRMALRRLAKTDLASWGRYLEPNGGIVWSRVAVGGFSQGAGMAALIGKRFPVRRVILFSGPWDTHGPGRLPAPWLSSATATPVWRWWAARHARERTSALLDRAYRALAVPEAHVMILDQDFPPPSSSQDNPAHRSTVRQLIYQPQWKILLGHPATEMNVPQ